MTFKRKDDADASHVQGRRAGKSAVFPLLNTLPFWARKAQNRVPPHPSITWRSAPVTGVPFLRVVIISCETSSFIIVQTASEDGAALLEGELVLARLFGRAPSHIPPSCSRSLNNMRDYGVITGIRRDSGVISGWSHLPPILDYLFISSWLYK